MVGKAMLRVLPLPGNLPSDALGAREESIYTSNGFMRFCLPSCRAAPCSSGSPGNVSPKRNDCTLKLNPVRRGLAR